MEITLRNGEKIQLDWNLIVIEYLEDYENGINQIYEDLINRSETFKTLNFIVYAFIAAVYPIEISYREAISLVNPNDLSRIIDFATEKMESFVEQNSENEEKAFKTVKKHRR